MEKKVLLEGIGEALPVFGESPEVRLRSTLSKLGDSFNTIEVSDPSEAEGASVLILRKDAVYEPLTLRKLLTMETGVVRDDAGEVLAIALSNATAEAIEASRVCMRGDTSNDQLKEIQLSELGPSYNYSLRKTEPPFAIVVTDPVRRERAERRIYASTYKGVTDLVTKYVWPEPAFHLTRWFLRFGIHPNWVTLLGAVLMVMALLLFWEGLFAAGLVCGWIMALLDTVDGKMARVGGTASKFGEILDHGIDLVHPPFWYLAWLYGLERVGHAVPNGWTEPILFTIFGTYIVVRLFEGYFIKRFGFHIHVWRPFDSRFREVVSRRNPNLILLTMGTIAGRPDWGLYALVIWQCVAVFVHLIQILHAEIARARSRGPRSWLETDAEPTTHMPA